MTRPLSRRREIEAAIAAHDSADRETPLPPNAARLLAVMFPSEDAVPTKRRRPSMRKDLTGRRALLLLRAWSGAGFLSRTPGGQCPNTYRLHLPPVGR